MYKLLVYQDRQNLHALVYTAKLIRADNYQDVLAAVSLESKKDAVKNLKKKMKKLKIII